MNGDKGKESWGWLTRVQLETMYSKETTAKIIAEKLKDPSSFKVCEDCPEEKEAYSYHVWVGKQESKFQGTMHFV